MKYPLEDIRILDFSIAVAAPLGATMLADMGAEVVKIERIQGEAQRSGLPAGMDDVLDTSKLENVPDEASWMAFNRGKKSLAVDVRTKEGKEIILKLARQADVIIESFRPGVADRLGIGYEDIRRINPNIIYCSFSGYGESGPASHRAGGDMWSQAMSGLVSLLGYPDGSPLMIPFPACDYMGATLIAYGIMVALFVRQQTGQGQALAINNLNSALYLQYGPFAEYLVHGDVPGKLGRSYGTPPFGPIRARDGDVLTIFGTGRLWPDFCRLVGLEALIDDPRFATDEARRANREEIGHLLDEAFSKKTREEWQRIFREAKMRCDPCLTYNEVVANPQLEANDMIRTVAHPTQGAIKMLGVPVKLKKTPGQPQGPAPLLGQHTGEILRDLGYTSAEIAEMDSQGIIKTKKEP
jgi:crotonobetainyl-CoA:carnitine CoA-transferase CaiB-like acyl-CoA transferase